MNHSVQSLIAALPATAHRYVSCGLDPADAFLALCDGLSPKQARSRARNLARAGGRSWPDRLPPHAVVDLSDAEHISRDDADPLHLLLAREVAQEAMDAADADAALYAAELAEVDTLAISAAFHLTRRRAQQIKAAQLAALEAGQGVLF